MGEIILIGDPRVKAVPVKENAEPFTDVLETYPELAFDHSRLHIQRLSKSISLSRREVARRLAEAQTYLPIGVKLLLKECYRPMWVQKIFWDDYYGYVLGKFPEWSEAQVVEECSKLNAPLDVAPHTTGAAVDLTLIDGSGRWLEMGTEFNASPLDTGNATYTDAENVSDEAKRNRGLLSSAMTRAGFVNYPTEWWHWSYGDKYWALRKGEPHALYSSQELEPEPSGSANSRAR